MFVPKKNLLVEFNGIKWHSTEKVMERDSRKYSIAMNNGYGLLVVTDEEWDRRKNTAKESIRKALGNLNGI